MEKVGEGILLLSFILFKGEHLELEAVFLNVII